MDIVCISCGERWTDGVLDGEPEVLDRVGGVVCRCPRCLADKPQTSQTEQERLETAKELAEFLVNAIEQFGHVFGNPNLQIRNGSVVEGGETHHWRDLS